MAVGLGGSGEVCQIEATLRLGVGQCALQRSVHDPTEKPLLLRRGSDYGQRAPGQHHRGKEGFNHQPLAKLLAHDHGFDGAAAETAVGFRKRHAKPA